MKLSVLQRLPQFYHWYAGSVGTKVELAELSELTNESSGSRKDNLVGLKLLSYPDSYSRNIMYKISQYLSAIDIVSNVIDIDGEPCLFVSFHDEAIALCCIKNLGIAIAEYMPAKPATLF